MEHLDTTQEKHKHYERDRQRKVSKRLDLMLDFLQKVSKRLHLMLDFLQNSYRLSLESAEPIHKIIDHYLKTQKNRAQPWVSGTYSQNYRPLFKNSKNRAQPWASGTHSQRVHKKFRPTTKGLHDYFCFCEFYLMLKEYTTPYDEQISGNTTNFILTILHRLKIVLFGALAKLTKFCHTSPFRVPLPSLARAYTCQYNSSALLFA
jgi:hypothetical protein